MFGLSLTPLILRGQQTIRGDESLTTRATMFGLTPEGLLAFGEDQMLRWSELQRASDAGLIDGDIHEMVI